MSEVLSPKPPTRNLASPRVMARSRSLVASAKGRMAECFGKASATGTPLGGSFAMTGAGGGGMIGVEGVAGRCRPGTLGTGGGAVGSSSPARAAGLGGRDALCRVVDALGDGSRGGCRRVRRARAGERPRGWGRAHLRREGLAASAQSRHPRCCGRVRPDRNIPPEQEARSLKMPYRDRDPSSKNSPQQKCPGKAV